MRHAARMLFLTTSMMGAGCTADFAVDLGGEGGGFPFPQGRFTSSPTSTPTATPVSTPGLVSANGVATGLYIGTGGSGDSDIDVGFLPALVLVQAAGASGVLILSNQGTKAKRVNGGTALDDGLLATTATGFLASGTLNEVGDPYHWIAIQDTAGIARTGQYTGSGSGNVTAPTGATYQPVGAFLSPAGNNPVAARTVFFPGSDSTQLDGTGPIADYLLGLSSASDGGISTGTAASTNGLPYYFASFAGVAETLDAKTYSVVGIGGGASVPVGFRPDAVLVQSTIQPRETFLKTRFMDDPDSIRLDGQPAADAIVSLDANGFVVGGDPGVSTPNEPYWFVALRTGS